MWSVKDMASILEWSSMCYSIGWAHGCHLSFMWLVWWAAGPFGTQLFQQIHESYSETTVPWDYCAISAGQEIYQHVVVSYNLKETLPNRHVTLWIRIKISGTQNPEEVRTDQVKRSVPTYYYLWLRAVVRPHAGEWQCCSQYLCNMETLFKWLMMLKLEWDLESI